MTVDVIRPIDAIRDVEAIAQYYVDQKTPATALKFGRAVTKTLDLLALFPDLGPACDPSWEERLNESGCQGWQLVSVISVDEKFAAVAFVKREILREVTCR